MAVNGLQLQCLWNLNLKYSPGRKVFKSICVLKCINYWLYSGPGSSVGIATAYGLDGPGIESRWGEIFRTSPDRP